MRVSAERTRAKGGANGGMINGRTWKRWLDRHGWKDMAKVKGYGKGGRIWRR